MAEIGRAWWLAGLLALGGCTVAPVVPPDAEPSPSVRSLLHAGSEAPRSARDVGVALAGGGTKAAAYAMGVLAGLADAGLYPRVETISTVSGGGYAAYFLYSKRMLSSHPRSGAPDLATLFADCLPHVYAQRGLLPSTLSGDRVCDRTGATTAMAGYRFQQFVRCRQDVLENDCHFEYEGTDGTEYANALVLAAGTAAAVLPNFVARTLFDWPMNLSPSREAYLQGIGTTYGLFPIDTRALRRSRDLAEACQEGWFLNCVSGYAGGQLDRSGLGFGELGAYTRANPDFPQWIINATASRSRSIFGWAREGRRDFSRYTLQISAFGARSGFYGAIGDFHRPAEERAGAAFLRTRDLLEAVTTSAAFLDSNQTALGQPWRMLAALGLHAAALDWGVDIPNPHVGPGWRAVHSLLPLWPWPWTRSAAIRDLPLPTYLADGVLRRAASADSRQSSAYIRLIDGGNNDNLGAYTLIEAGSRHILVSDHAQDSDGEMGDLCLLHNEVRLRSAASGRPKRLLIPGLADFARHCLQFAKESECDGGSCSGIPGVSGPALARGGYPIQAWRHPVLVGCIRDADSRTGDDTGGDCDGQVDHYLYVLKPALDREVFFRRFVSDGRASDAACDAGNTGPCEVAAYLLYRGDRRSDRADPGAFPQHSTVGMTFASNARRFGAYRELARWQMREASRLLGSPDAFRAELTRQTRKKIARTPFQEPATRE